MMSAEPAAPENHSSLSFTRSGFNPSPADAIIVRLILRGLRLNRLNVNIPLEIALHIAQFADYNPRIACRRAASRVYKVLYYGDIDPWIDGSSHGIAALYLTSPPLPKPPPTCPFRVRPKYVTFQMRSGDQGWATWGGHGTYENSHTWFEASIMRPTTPDAPPQPDMGVDGYEFADRVEVADYRGVLNSLGWDFVLNGEKAGWLVHHNITASEELNNYRTDWDTGVVLKLESPPSMGDGVGFLDSLQAGDAVALWARAEQRLWTNITEEATIEIGYEVI